MIWLLDGQTHEHYHSEEGRKERLAAVKFAVERELCWPPWCAHPKCDPVRAYLKSRGGHYTGVPPEVQDG